jgi:hypothetical protein
MKKPQIRRDVTCDIAVVGAGAAGLAAAIFAGEATRGSGRRILLLDSARKPGAKILVSGGGRCNVTNHSVGSADFWGGSAHTIGKVIGRFSNQDTITWFEGLGVKLKREATDKYFPWTDSAKTVLSALLGRVAALGIESLNGTRVVGLRPAKHGFTLDTVSPSDDQFTVKAARVIIATGGLALPKSGSDGAGLAIMQQLGHEVVPPTPALTPLVLSRGPTIGGRFAEFKGITLDARLELCLNRATKPLIAMTGSLLFTHFGLSGPVALDLSRHWLRLKHEQPEANINVYLALPRFSSLAESDAWLREAVRLHPKRQLSTILEEVWPSRLAQAIAADVGDGPAAQLSRATRQRLTEQLVRMPVPVSGTRDYSYAEATAGGVDLREIVWQTMESRKVPGLYLCGEILDVDGRIGGFNFQWAWSSGYLAGRGAAASL